MAGEGTLLPQHLATRSCGLGRQIRVDTDRLQAWIEGEGRTRPGGWRRDPEASNV